MGPCIPGTSASFGRDALSSYGGVAPVSSFQGSNSSLDSGFSSTINLAATSTNEHPPLAPSPERRAGVAAISRLARDLASSVAHLVSPTQQNAVTEAAGRALELLSKTTPDKRGERDEGPGSSGL